MLSDSAGRCFQFELGRGVLPGMGVLHPSGLSAQAMLEAESEVHGLQQPNAIPNRLVLDKAKGT